MRTNYPGNFRIPFSSLWSLVLVAVVTAWSSGRALANEAATALATVTAGFVTSVTVTYGGSNYITAPIVSFSGGGGTGAQASAILQDGRVALIIVLNAGSGYTSAPEVIIEAPPQDASLSLDFVPRIKVEGNEGDWVEIDWTESLDGEVQWHFLTALQLESGSGQYVDLAGVDTQRFYRVRSYSFGNPPPGMAGIPGGSFSMGNPFPGEGFANEFPVHQVTLGSYFMDTREVTVELWNEVRDWGLENGYTDLQVGGGRGADHPVFYVNWFNAVKWCNARSEMVGRQPAYYTSADKTHVYRVGQIDIQSEMVRWNAGFRLPTEAEWERAARGGQQGVRFPFGATISHANANYNSSGNLVYDVSPTQGRHPLYLSSGTNPVGRFAANAYGLYDMIGNVWEWCWDKDGPYTSDPATNPTGPSGGSARILRGCSWNGDADLCRSSYRGVYEAHISDNDGVGFRTVLPLIQP